ncbi:hypothetical protein LTR86_009413 [Recurvomyces mirabilis]|nr:hypothetical protein LTR86_009413 [Recurvomyces mirabilis]
MSTHSTLERLQAFHFSTNVTQYFCPTCGTHVLGSMQDASDSSEAGLSYYLLSGTLEQADGVYELRGHEWISDTGDGGFSDFIQTVNGKDLARWPHGFYAGEELPQYWQASHRQSQPPTATNRLYAHCKCNGVQFWIAKPSARSARGRAPWPDLLVPFHYTGIPPPKDEAWWLPAGGTKYLAGLCSCNSCCLATGMEWVEWSFVPTIDISLDADGKILFSRDFGTLKHYRSSDIATRHFCGTCGATVFWDGDMRPDLIDVAVGLLNAPEGARAENWLEWQTGRLSYREDAMSRAESLVHGVEAGLLAYGKRRTSQRETGHALAESE